VRQFLHEILVLILFIHRTALLVLTLDLKDIVQDLDIQVFGSKPRHERGKDKCIVLLTDVHTERVLIVLDPTACHPAAGSLLSIIIRISL
jgi:hypothetical protein